MDQKHALWQLAFRPFFLSGAIFAVLAMLYWLHFLSGGGGGIALLPAVTWHSHEMVFGFAGAIIGGFVLTAAQNWTGTRGVHGARLVALFCAWALARILLATAGRPLLPLAAFADLAFYPALGLLMFPYLSDPELRMERVFYVFFGLFFISDLAVWLDAAGISAFAGASAQAIRFALNLVVVMIVFMGGRVIPFFTESELSRKQPRVRDRIETAAMASSVLYVLSALALPEGRPAALVAFVAAGLHAVRLAGWQVPRVRRIPLLWVLHGAYFWIVAGYALSGLAALGFLPMSAAIHAFGVGGIGAVIHGMISRVSLGHTGRRLHPSAPTVAGFAFVLAAAPARIAASVAGGAAYQPLLLLAGGLWIAAFSLFAVVYAPILLSPRVDGRAG